MKRSGHPRKRKVDMASVLFWARDIDAEKIRSCRLFGCGIPRALLATLREDVFQRWLLGGPREGLVVVKAHIDADCERCERPCWRMDYDQRMRDEAKISKALDWLQAAAQEARRADLRTAKAAALRGEEVKVPRTRRPIGFKGAEIEKLLRRLDIGGLKRLRIDMSVTRDLCGSIDPRDAGLNLHTFLARRHAIRSRAGEWRRSKQLNLILDRLIAEKEKP